MGNAVRWTPEQLDEYRKRGTVRTHRIEKSEIKPPPAPPKESNLERRFDQQLRANGITDFERGWFFIVGRDFELDFAFPKRKLAVEVQGMAHRIKGKWKRDIEKRALAMLEGWRVLEVDGATIRDGRAIEWTKRMLALP